MELSSVELSECYDVYDPDFECLVPWTERIGGACENAACAWNSTSFAGTMVLYDKKPVETLTHVWHIFWTILPTAFFFAIARITTHFVPRLERTESTKRFLIEFAVIVVPSVVNINVANEVVGLVSLLMIAFLLIVVVATRCIQRAREREFEVGKRPCMLTMARATINYLTVLCILAIDFESFPKKFRKSRRFGASLMDTGIGLFVFSMGTVSRRPRKLGDVKRLLYVVAPILLLGLVRTAVIMAIDYHQDEHEYGVHLNAFFTLGLTKLFGTIASAIATTETLLLPLGIGILAIHETVLQVGLSDFVMDGDIERDSLWTANREGLCSLPGFIGIYILSMYIGRWLQSKNTLSFNEFMGKLSAMATVSAGIWLIVVVSIFFVGIARVTCNFGYAAWVLGIAVTMTPIFMVLFDLVLNTILPVAATNTPVAGVESGSGEEGQAILKPEANQKPHQIPIIIEAINLNGLLFFLVANVLTGGVNIFLKPNDRSDSESVFILTLYMLLAIGFVFILFRKKIRIA